MNRLLLLSLGLVISASGAFAQGYLEEFDGDADVTAGPNYTATQADGLLTIVGNGDTGADEAVTVAIDGGTFDMSSNNIVSVRARTNSIGTSLGVELVDADGNETMIAGADDALIAFLTGDQKAFTLDFSGKLGSVDASRIAKIKLVADPGIGFFQSSIIVDAISLVDELSSGPNLAYVDQFDNDSSITAFTVYDEFFVNETVAASGVAVISGVGAKPGYVDFRYSPRNQVDFTPTSVDLPASNGKLYIKMKSTVPNTNLRIDAIDSRGYMTAGVGITKQVGTEFAVYEYDYTNGYFADRWTPPCSEETAPCPVDGSDIVSFRIIPEPGQEIFTGTITFEWLTIGESLEPIAEKPLLYTDCFEDGLNNFVSEGNGFTPVETNGQLEVTITNEKPQYGTFTYNINDRLTQEASSVDITEASTLNVRMRVEGPDALIRIDAVNSANFASTQSSVRAPVTDEFETYVYEFAGAKDGGYGGSACETGPCDVALDSIVALYFYVNDETDATYEGKLIIDEISFGRKIKEGECNETGVDAGEKNYRDNIATSGAQFFMSETDNFTVAADGGVVTITGDGQADPYQRVRYTFNDGTDPILVDLGGDDLRIEARVQSGTAVARVDMVDNMDIHTTNAGRVMNLTEEFQTFTLNYSGSYQDGGYGGTACPVSNNANPCDVDGQRLAGFTIYPEPEPGKFGGVIEIRSIQTGTISGVNAPREVSAVRVSPNPVTDGLRVAYDLEVDGDVAVNVYDGIGRQVATQRPGQRQVGSYTHDFDLGSLPAGIYQVVLSVDGYVGKTVSVVKR